MYNSDIIQYWLLPKLRHSFQMQKEKYERIDEQENIISLHVNEHLPPFKNSSTFMF